jgi:hypothetical protein
MKKKNKDSGTGAFKGVIPVLNYKVTVGDTPHITRRVKKQNLVACSFCEKLLAVGTIHSCEEMQLERTNKEEIKLAPPRKNINLTYSELWFWRISVPLLWVISLALWVTNI